MQKYFDHQRITVLRGGNPFREDSHNYHVFKLYRTDMTVGEFKKRCEKLLRERGGDSTPSHYLGRHSSQWQTLQDGLIRIN